MWTIERDTNRDPGCFHYAYNGVRKCWSKDIDWDLMDYLESSNVWSKSVVPPFILPEIYEYEYKNGEFIEYMTL
jgi:hypothetical protein